MLDTIQSDIMIKDQLKIMVRHMHILRNDRIDRKLKKPILGFFCQKDLTAEGMKNKIISVLDEVKVSIENSFGQG